MTTDRKKKWENEWEGEEWWLLSPHPLWSGAVTLLPPPTWKIILRPHTHTHAHTHTHTHTLRVTENPIPVRGSTVFICFHTNKPRSGGSSPHAGHSEQLSRWITGSGGVEQFPVRPTTEEKITHIGYSASPFPSAPLLQGIPSEARSLDSPGEFEL